uniref:Uncharacterized protein TCIL3000_11_6830 n=1 Tax=Trypanosoma congolense (strain IL3000) TaxID=1068625 RepID=G0V0T6_TRYCI|nr:unnamed protein product [Trypanosoma congolense IL3000]
MFIYFSFRLPTFFLSPHIVLLRAIMTSSRTHNALAHQLQEERLEKLCDDNAFVNVADVLRRRKHDAFPADGNSTEVDFFEVGTTSATAPPRIHLTRFLLEQHRSYLKAMGLDEDEKQHCDSKAGGDSSSVSTWSSAASSEKSEIVSTSRRGKRGRKRGRSKYGKGRKASQQVPNDSAPPNREDNNRNTVNIASGDSSLLAWECRYIRDWCHAQKVGSAEVQVPTVSYTSMTAPPPLHAGGHHLCSVCLLPAGYRCVRCRRALFCSIECHVVHEATRCMKFIV